MGVYTPADYMYITPKHFLRIFPSMPSGQRLRLLQKRNPPEELTSGGLFVISFGWWVLTVESGRVPKLYRKYLA